MKIMKKNFEILAAAAAMILAMLAFAWADGGFRFLGPLRRIVTPNGDVRNDSAVFCFDNPSDSDVSGTIYSLLGSHVADFGSKTDPALSGCPSAGLFKAQSLSWDGRSNGSTVHSGVYIYQIRAEGLTFTGSILVVR